MSIEHIKSVLCNQPAVNGATVSLLRYNFLFIRNNYVQHCTFIWLYFFGAIVPGSGL